MSITPHAAPDDDGYGALTAKLQAEATLGGATFEKFSIDLTTRRHADAPVDQVALKRIINDESLNGLPKVPTIPVENHLADKVCALYEKHGVSGKGTSTRYRDLADIVRIIMATKFDAERLHVLLKREAGRRRIALPQTVVSPDVAWITRFPIAARDFAEYPAGLHPLKESLSFARRCLDAILDGSRRSGSWNPDQQQWENSTD